MRKLVRDCVLGHGNRYRLTRALALIGALMHALAFVQHSVHHTRAVLAHSALIDDMIWICRGGSGPHAAVAPAPLSDLPHVPPPADAQAGCAICGPGSVPALPVPQVAGAVLLTPVSAPVPAAGDRMHAAGSIWRPFARGPPAAA